MLDFWQSVIAAGCGYAAWEGVKVIVGVVVEATRRSIDADVEWRRKHDAPLFEDRGLVGVEADLAMSLPLAEGRRRVAEPLSEGGVVKSGLYGDFHDEKETVLPRGVELITNHYSPVGFVAASVRPTGRWQDGEHIQDIGAVLEIWAEQLLDELRPCEKCSRIAGIHSVTCCEVADGVDMAAAEMLTQEREKAVTEPTTLEQRHHDAED